MATALPCSAVVIAKSPRPNFGESAGEADCELEAIYEAKNPTHVTNEWPLLHGGITLQTMSGNHADQAHLE